MTNLLQKSLVWWWKGIWKSKCPLKPRLFMWCLLRKKVLTWDGMKFRVLEGLGWFSLCKGDDKTSPHLFLGFPFSIQTWRFVSFFLGQTCSWHGPSIEEAWKYWVQDHRNKNIKALPLLINWGIWLARNVAIFKEKALLPDIFATKIHLSLHIFDKRKIPPLRQIVEEQINITRPWDFFNGASQDNIDHFGGWGVLHLSPSHFYKIKQGLGQGTNNFVELIALNLLLTFVGEKGILTLHIFGYSMVVTNGLRKIQMCHNINLTSILEEVFLITNIFTNMSFNHAYRERNATTYTLSKEGTLMAHR
jgi:ribonuclease HI